MKIKTTIYMEPIPKGRPRVVTKGGKVITYTPKKTTMAEDMIRAATMSMGSFDDGIPLKLEAIFYRLKPRTTPKKVLYPVTRPDISNYLKTLEDALEKFAYQNDSQIVDLVAKKRFGSPPRIELCISDDIEEGG